MTKLKSISLTNVRRFGENTTIEFGEGATIIVAPNGTGKTSIFEAIELVLTGKVNRLKTLSILIRDQQKYAIAGLEFHCGAKKTVRISHDEEPVISGDLASITQNTDQRDLPYLLRLTHMLDQRGSNWFVQSDNAGEQLSKLPIGRDAVSANKLMMSAKRAANSLFKEINRELEEAKENQINFQELIALKKAAEKRYGQPLLSISELVQELNKVTKIIIFEEETIATNVHEIKDFIIRLKARIEIKNQEVTHKKIKYIEIKSIIESYSDLYKKFQHATTELKETQSSLILATEKLQKKQLQEANVNSAYKEALGELKLLKNSVEKVERSNKLRDEVNILNKDLLSVGVNIEVSEKNEFVTKEQLNKLLELQNKYLSLNKSLGLLVHEEIMVNKVRDDLLEFKSLKEKIVVLRAEYRLSKPNIDICSNEAKVRVKEKAQAEKELDKAELNLKYLEKTSDSIRSAISVIASELPKHQDDCPVCGEHHGFEELKRRIGVALEKINPEIIQATERVVQLKSKLEASAQLVIETANEESTAIAINKEIEKKGTTLSAQLNELIDNLVLSESYQDSIVKIKQFILADDIQNAEKILKFVSENIKEQNNIITDEKKLTPVDLGTDIEKLKESLSLAIVTLRALKLNKKEVNRLLEQKTKIFESIALTDNDNITINDIIEKEQSLNTSEALALPIKVELDTIQSQIDEITKEDQNKQIIVEDYSSKINKIKVAWERQGLSEEPNFERLTTFIHNLDSKLQVINEGKEKLTYVQTEVSRWDENVELNALQDRLDSIKGKTEETHFLKSLTVTTKNLESKVQDISSRLETLNFFSKKLTNELNDVDRRIKEIEPVWRYLLSRIVLEPRYSLTGLDITTKYNKKVASISAPLHGSVIPVSSLASEAQITDLQLTFLMAMAQKQNWSPWRALLLDDPTQHHDLVHSSSVFDLLRDFIVEEGFQLVLTTHDKVQANFLKRKLENDGVPVTICQLLATEHGVIPREVVS